MTLLEKGNMPKKKQNIIIISGMVLLSLLLLWLMKSEQKQAEPYNFAIADTSNISKIFIADMTGNSISLDRIDNVWQINNTYKVQNRTMKVILRTIKDISVQRPVAESAYNKVIADLATNGVKVELYKNNEQKPVKTYTIGSNTADHLGTYMLLENAEQPYIMHIPGFNGVLGPRYGLQGNIVNSAIWRDKSIFNLKAEKIFSITLINEKGVDSSFTIKNNDGLLSLFDKNLQEIKVNQEALFLYLNKYRNINCESYKDKNIKEKLTIENKLYSLIVAHQNGTDTLKVYQMRDKNKIRTHEENYTVERMYATLNDGDVMLIQNYVFNKLLITIEQLKEQ